VHAESLAGHRRRLDDAFRRRLDDAFRRRLDDAYRRHVDLRYGDGRLTIRSLCPEDLEMDLAAKDERQIEWLWEPGEREQWTSMTLAQQRAHALRGLEAAAAAFGPGPKWRFAVDTTTTRYVAYVDCDLANPHVPAGQANVAYSAHPAHRGRGYVSGGVRLAVRFLADRTAATEAHLVVDAANGASLRVAHAVGAHEVERWSNERGRVMVRHVLEVGRESPAGTGPMHPAPMHPAPMHPAPEDRAPRAES
jgi:RimJ/RimL family protein N-acetyltransferase